MNNDLSNQKLNFYIFITNVKDVEKALKNDKLFKALHKRLINIAKETMDLKFITQIKAFRGGLYIQFHSEFGIDYLSQKSLEFICKLSQQLVYFNQDFYKLKNFFIEFYLKLTKESKTQTISTIDAFKYTYSEDKSSVISTVDILVDQEIYEATKKFYTYHELDKILYKNRFYNLFILDSKKILKGRIEDKIENSLVVKIPKKIKSRKKHFIVEKNAFNFFTKPANIVELHTISLTKYIKDNLNVNKANIFLISSSYESGGFNNIDHSIFQNEKFVQVDCFEDHIDLPFFTIREIIKKIINITELDIFNNPASMQNLPPTMQSLLKLQALNSQEHQENYINLLNEFIPFLYSQDNLVVAINNFDSIDKGSLNVIKFIFDNNLNKTPFIFSLTNDFRIFSYIYSLLDNQNLHVINLIPDEQNQLFNHFKLSTVDGFNDLKLQLQNNFYPSIFYLKQLLNYFKDNHILVEQLNYSYININRVTKIPNDIDDIFKKRLLLLSKDSDVFNLFVFLVLFANNLMFQFLILVKVEKYNDLISILVNKDFISFDNNIIEVKYINFYRRALRSIKDKVNIDISKYFKTLELLLPAFYPLEHKNSTLALITSNNILSEISLSFGDYDIYVKTSKKLLDLLDQNDSITKAKESQTKSENDKEDIVEQGDNTESKIQLKLLITSTLFTLRPDLIVDIIDELTDYYYKYNNIPMYRTFLFFSLNVYLQNKNYNKAYELINKLIVLMENTDYNLSSDKFNPNMFFLIIHHLAILFNIGKMDSFIERCEVLLPKLDITKFEKVYEPFGTKERFYNIFNEVIIYYLLSNILRSGFGLKEKIESIVEMYTESKINLDLILAINDILKSGNLSEFINNIDIKTLDNTGKILYTLYKVILNSITGEYKDNSELLHISKKIAILTNNKGVNILLDAIAADLHCISGNKEMSGKVLLDILEQSKNLGYNMLHMYILYLIAKHNFIYGNVDTALSIIAEVLPKIENQDCNIVILSIECKILLVEIFLKKEDYIKAEMLLQQCLKYIRLYKITRIEQQIINKLDSIKKIVNKNNDKN